jgi:hypothetical protein
MRQEIQRLNGNLPKEIDLVSTKIMFPKETILYLQCNNKLLVLLIIRLMG